MNYIDFYLSLPNMSWLGIVSLFFLILMRIAPIVAISPFLGARVAPVPARMGLAICLTLIFLPFLAAKTTTPILFDSSFVGYSIKELFIGFLLAFFIAIPFYIVQSSGVLIDYLRGASIMQAQDPTMQNQASPIGILYNYILIVIFFQINGLSHFFNGVLASYELIPPDGFLSSQFFTLPIDFWNICFDILNRVATMTIQLSAPALVAILMAEMFLGIANRLAPQVQIAFLGMSIKSLLGLGLLWTSWFFLLKQFGNNAEYWLNIIDTTIHKLSILKPTAQ